jgi:6-phosphogluconolactonase
MEQNPKIIIADNNLEFARTSADIFVLYAEKAVQKYGRFVVAISGGATPTLMYRLLAGDEYRSKAPWADTHFFWVDERCLPPDHSASNYGRALIDFIESVPIPPAQVHNMPVDLPVEKGALKYEQELMVFFQLEEGAVPVFDLIFLGVGADGHTASLFPGSKALEERHRLVIAVKGGNPDVDRLTMTLPVINNARKIVFLVSGKGKAQIVHDLFVPTQKVFPAQRIKPLKRESIWVLDKDASSLLPWIMSCVPNVHQ